MDLKVCRHVQKGHLLKVPWHCVDEFVIRIASRPEAVLSLFMIGDNNCKRPRWLLVPELPVLSYFSCVAMNLCVAACSVISIDQVDFAVTTKFCFINCAFYSVELFWLQ